MNEKPVALLNGVSAYFESVRPEKNEPYCSKHRISHTGKNAYAIVINLFLHETTQNTTYLKRARCFAVNTLKNLYFDKESNAWIFLPGRLANRNMSTSAIDSGACVDALASFLARHSDALPPKERGRVSDAVRKVAGTYLATAVQTKPITNQRLWAATGLASAYALFKEPAWKEALKVSLKQSFQDMTPEGAFYYSPRYAQNNGWLQENWITPYYHSRCIAFSFHVLEALGLNAYRKELEAATDFLVSITGANGVKAMALEAKSWYWRSRYEVASNAFDVYAFLKAHALLGKKAYLDYALRGFEQVTRHVLPDGGITSHHGRQENFQCRLFWNAHLAWLARAAPLLQEKAVSQGHFKVHADAGVVKFENGRYAAIVACKKPAANIHYANGVAGGSFVYFGRAANAWEDQSGWQWWTETCPGSYVVSARNRKPGSVFKAAVHNTLPFVNHTLWISLNEALAGKPGLALRFAAENLAGKFWDQLQSRYATHWASGTPEPSPHGFTVLVRPCTRDQFALPGTELVRRIDFLAGTIKVQDRFSSCDPLNRVIFQKPLFARKLSVETNTLKNENDSSIAFTPAHAQGLEIALSFEVGA